MLDKPNIDLMCRACDVVSKCHMCDGVIAGLVQRAERLISGVTR